MMDKETDYKIQYLVLCISEFARQNRLTGKQAFAYLSRYEGLAFLDECYEAEHTLSLQDAIDDMTVICKRNGGRIGV